MKVLLAIEDEETGHEIADFAISHLAESENEFKIVHVIRPISSYVSLGIIPELVDELRQDELRVGAALVRDIALELRDVFHTPNIDERMVAGQPAEEILKLAEQWQPDLIVVCSHNRRGLAKFIAGSISTTVAAHAQCAVLVLRPTRVLTNSETTGVERNKVPMPRAV